MDLSRKWLVMAVNAQQMAFCYQKMTQTDRNDKNELEGAWNLMELYGNAQKFLESSDHKMSC